MIRSKEKRPRRRYLRTYEAADRIGVHPNTIRNWVHSGRIVPAMRLPINGECRFTIEEVARVARERKT